MLLSMTTGVSVAGIGAPVALTSAGVIGAGPSVASTDPDVDVAEDPPVSDRVLRQVDRLLPPVQDAPRTTARRVLAAALVSSCERLL